MMNNKLIYKIFGYIILAAVVYLLFRFVPKNPISTSDALVITVIILLTCIVIENLCNLYSGNAMESFECNKKCSKAVENYDGNIGSNAGAGDNYNNSNSN